MTKQKEIWDWNREYRLLLTSSKTTPPNDLTSNIKKRIEVELNPSGRSVFFKLFAIHFISGVLTLFVCPQFGLGFSERSHAFLSLLLGLGEHSCMLICGALFLGSTGLVAALFLKAEEVRTIQRSRGLQWMALAFLSVGFFLALQEQERTIPIGLAATWIVGALLGGTSVFRLSWELRSRLRRRLAF